MGAAAEDSVDGTRRRASAAESRPGALLADRVVAAGTGIDNDADDDDGGANMSDVEMPDAPGAASGFAASASSGSSKKRKRKRGKRAKKKSSAQYARDHRRRRRR
mgnify:CR=1 FL=1